MNRRLHVMSQGRLPNGHCNAAAIMGNAPSPEAAKDFIRFLTSPSSQASLAAAGAN
jgi:ABC-type glycerol-3-phosphate transport system substrate-binding protein